MSNLKIVVIGGVAAGPKAAARAHRLDPEAEITIIERGNTLSYSGCGLPYYIEGKFENIGDLYCTPMGTPYTPGFFERVKCTHMMNRTEAVAIDRQAKTVEVVRLESGEHEIIPYDKLVLATGGMPSRIPIEGSDLNYVFRLNHPDHAVAIKEAVTSGHVRNAAIIGGGLIGMEVTEALAVNGVNVHIIDRNPLLLHALLDFETSTFLMKHMEKNGVHIHSGEAVLRFEGDEQGNVRRVYTDKAEFDAEMVLLAIGVRANTKLAVDAGLEIGVTGAIAVNEYLQTSDPDIYAGGDCVENLHLITGEKVFSPMGSVANRHGRVIGTNIITGNTVQFPGVIGTGVMKMFDYSAGKTGLTESQARKAGFDVVTSLTPAPDCAHFYTEPRIVLLKMVADRKTRRLLGVQAVGSGEVVKRIDMMSSAIMYGAKIDDITNLDHGYAPPFSTAIDLSQHAANVICNKLAGLAKSYTPKEVKEKADRGDDFIWLDVRTQPEYNERFITDPRVQWIPLERLQDRVHQLTSDTNAEIVTFCSVGSQSYEAQRMLEGMGYTNVRFMDGGIVAWPYETRGSDPQSFFIRLAQLGFIAWPHELKAEHPAGAD